jgi:hypothetical protein
MIVWNGHYWSLMFALDARQVTKHEGLTTDLSPLRMFCRAVFVFT